MATTDQLHELQRRLRDADARYQASGRTDRRALEDAMNLVDQIKAAGPATDAPTPAMREAAKATGRGQVPLIAAGNVFERKIAGAEDPALALLEATSSGEQAAGLTKDRADLKAKQGDSARRMRALTDEYPFLSFLGEMAPGIALRNPLTLGLSAGLDYGTPKERGLNAVAAYGGAHVGNQLGNVVAAAKGPRSMAGEPSGAYGQIFHTPGQNQWGIPTSRGQESGWKPFQIAEDVVRQLPGGGVVNRARDASYQGTNRAISQTFGADMTNLSPAVLGDSRRRLGGLIGDIAARNTLDFDHQLFTDIGQHWARSVRDIPGEPGQLVRNQINDFFQHVDGNGQVPGRFYHTLDTRLGELARNAQNGSNAAATPVLRDFRQSLRDAFDRSISPADQDLWGMTRRQYSNLKTVSEATKNKGVNAAGEGEDLSFAQLLQAVNRAQPGARFGAGNELADIAQWGKGVLGDKIPNSGTAQRLFIQNLITHPGTALGIAGGAAAGANQLGIDERYSLGLLMPWLAGRALAGQPASEFARELSRSIGRSAGATKAEDFLPQPQSE